MNSLDQSHHHHLPSPALVVAVLALVVALGSTAVALVPASKRVSGVKLAKRSEPGNRFVADSVTGKEIKESKLKALPSALAANTATTATHATTATTATLAGDAASLGGFTAANLTAKCPSGTTLLAAGCIESGLARAPLAYIQAAQACGALGRTLPSAAQLTAFPFNVASGAGPEASSDLENSGAMPIFIAVDTTNGNQSQTSAATAFRCVAPMGN